MNYLKDDIVFQEIPGEISLAIYFTGCPLHCQGCHSPELWNANLGKPLTQEYFESRIKRYRGSITCILFMGGDWSLKELNFWVDESKKFPELKVALFTGRELDELPHALIKKLDFLKTGPWITERGGLDSPNTNQRFYSKELRCF